MRGKVLSDNQIIWMSVTQYAAHRGVTKAAVSKAIKNNRLTDAVDATGTRKKINQEIADHLWNKNGKLKVDTPVQPVNKESEEIPKQKTAGSQYSQSRAIKEVFAAKNEQLKYEERAGSLCRAEDVAKAAKDMSRLTRDYLLNLADKLAPLLTAETDINEVHKIITEEVHNALTNLSSGKIF